jgi:hypothetical protein
MVIVALAFAVRVILPSIVPAPLIGFVLMEQHERVVVNPDSGKIVATNPVTGNRR